MTRADWLRFAVKLNPDIWPVCSNYLTASPLILNRSMLLQGNPILSAEALNIVGIPFGLSHCATSFISASISASTARRPALSEHHLQTCIAFSSGKSFSYDSPQISQAHLTGSLGGGQKGSPPAIFSATRASNSAASFHCSIAPRMVVPYVIVNGRPRIRTGHKTGCSLTVLNAATLSRFARAAPAVKPGYNAARHGCLHVWRGYRPKAIHRKFNTPTLPVSTFTTI